MTDSLTIWGTDYTGVKGFKADDGNDNTLAYIRPQGTKSITQNGTGIDVSEYAAVNVNVSGGGSPTLQTKTKNYTPTESQQTEAVSADSEYDGLDTVNVTVGAISSSYVGSGITRRSSSDLTASGATVSVPTGYYESSASKSVASGTEGTPTATKGTVSNHSVSVTPSVTNSAGYISGGTRTGTAVTVTASELASGNKSISDNGSGIDVVGYSTVDVTVPNAFTITDTSNTSGTTAVITAGTGGGGATAHEIHLEFSDSTDEDIDVYYDDSWVGNLITSTTPTTYGQKTVIEAQLDGVTWYEFNPIPLNTQLIDFTAITNGYVIDDNGEEAASQWSCCSDFTAIDPSMTFSYIGYQWYSVAFYNAQKTFISGFNIYQDPTVTVVNDYGNGTLSPSNIPSTAAFVRISSYPNNPTSSQLSLIRTA